MAVGGGAQEGQRKEGREDDDREDHEDGLPVIDGEQQLGGGGADDLTCRPGGGGDAQGQAAVFGFCGAADDGQDHAEPGARNAETDQDIQKLHLTRRDGEGRQQQPRRIHQRPCDDGAAVAELLGQGAENRLADTPGQVLNRDGHGKVGPQPAEFGGNRDLEHAETGAEGKAQEQNRAARNQDGGEDRGFRHGTHLIVDTDPDPGAGRGQTEYCNGINRA